MGIHRENGGYSASVEGLLIVGSDILRLAKTNGRTLVLAEPRELAPKTCGELRITVDGEVHSRRVVLPSGSTAEQTLIEYDVIAPF
jgi:hypothetical protein